MKHLINSKFIIASIFVFGLFFSEGCKQVSCDPKTTILPKLSLYRIEDPDNTMNPDTVQIGNLINELSDRAIIPINARSSFYIFAVASHPNGMKRLSVSSFLSCRNASQNLDLFVGYVINGSKNECSVGDKVVGHLSTSVKIRGDEILDKCERRELSNATITFSAKGYNSTSPNTIKRVNIALSAQ